MTHSIASQGIKKLFILHLDILEGHKREEQELHRRLCIPDNETFAMAMYRRAYGQFSKETGAMVRHESPTIVISDNQPPHQLLST